jgi:fumarate hydratase class II
MHIAAVRSLAFELEPALRRLQQDLQAKAQAWDRIVKIGRTHLMDATPIRMGQVVSGYAAQADRAIQLAQAGREALQASVPIGGTAVGTGINTHPEFGQRVCDALAKQLSDGQDLPFHEAKNHPAAQAAKDAFVEAHGQLKTIAVSLSKIANDIRHLGSGPRCGIFELQLPAIQPGSSIMPGKVNPVICESVVQVSCRVAANDQAITMGGFGGVGSIFELNVAMPMIADAMMESIDLLTNVSNVMVDKLLDGLQVNEKRCRNLIDQSLMMVTSLAPEIGYDKAAKIAKQAFEEDRTIRELVREQSLLDEKRLEAVLDPDRMTRPSE